MNNPEIEVGSIVIYKDPAPDEIFNGEPLRFHVLEVNGDRCLMEPVTIPLYFKPVTLAKIEDLEIVRMS